MEIFDMAWTLFSGVLGVIIGAWIAKRMLFSRENIMESVDSILDYALNTIEGQSKVKAVMEKVSEGLFKGTIIGSRGSGKLKWQDMVMQMALGYAQKQGWVNLGQEQPQSKQESSKSGMNIQ